MRKIYNFSIIATLAILLLAGAVNAQTSTSANNTADDALVGVVVQAVTKMPTGWGLWWRGVKEVIVVNLTFDPVKKAEKRIQFAEENIKIAEYVSANTTDAKKQAWAQKRVEKANEHIAKLEESKDEWINHPEARKRELIKNLATHQIHREKVLDKMEERLPTEKAEKLQEIRTKAIEQREEFIDKIKNNPNIPSSTLRRLENVRTMVQTKLQDIKDYQADKQELLKKIKDGSVTSTGAIKDLWEDRKETLKANREIYKDKKEDLKEKAKDNGEAVKKKLEILNKGKLPIKKPAILAPNKVVSSSVNVITQ